MTVTEQGCAELAERLSDPFYRGSSQHLRSWSEIDELFMRSAAILSRLTVEGLAGVIAEAHDGWAKDNSPLTRPAYIAQALLTYITGGNP